MKDIAIVIPCYNRVKTLNTLLASLKKAKYDRSVELIFSIDFSGNNDVFEVAEKFDWPFGKKTIVRHSENIGLRKNIISCGDLTESHDAVIVLEDDLIVSPYFFDYASKACDFYWDDERVGGISLYSYRYNENFEKREFIPLTEGYDTFFIQFTSSWGQLWTKKQWADFKDWYLHQGEDLESFRIPSFVKKWKKSWKKFNIAYLTETDRYYVYPICSFTTMVPAQGVHCGEVSLTNPFMVPLCTNIHRDFLFQDSNGALKYDSFFEIKNHEIEIEGAMVEVDFNIYCSKEPGDLEHDYYVTINKQSKIRPIMSWGREQIPIEANILNNINGEDVFLYKKEKGVIHSLSLEDKFQLRFLMAGTDLLLLAIKKVAGRLVSPFVKA